MDNRQMIVSKSKEIMFLDNQGKPNKLQREYTERRPAPAIKKDHIKEMRQGLIIFAVGCAIMTAFVFCVLRPFEHDISKNAITEYKKLLETTKALATERNDLVDRLRDTYRNGR
jgi:hypothetical protein